MTIPEYIKLSDAIKILEDFEQENLNWGFCSAVVLSSLIDNIKHLKPVTPQEIIGSDADIDRLKELVAADADGRCVVLPCKPSDVTVYEIRDKKHALGVGVHPRHVGCAMVWSGGKYRLCHQGESSLTGENFGKKWHLTQQAAEAALKEMKTHENHT